MFSPTPSLAKQLIDAHNAELNRRVAYTSDRYTPAVARPRRFHQRPLRPAPVPRFAR